MTRPGGTKRRRHGNRTPIEQRYLNHDSKRNGRQDQRHQLSAIIYSPNNATCLEEKLTALQLAASERGTLESTAYITDDTFATYNKAKAMYLMAVAYLSGGSYNKAKTLVTSENLIEAESSEEGSDQYFHGVCDFVKRHHEDPIRKRQAVEILITNAAKSFEFRYTFTEDNINDRKGFIKAYMRDVYLALGKKSRDAATVLDLPRFKFNAAMETFELYRETTGVYTQHHTPQ